MNSLSWLIYLADVLPSISTFVFYVWVFVGLICGVIYIIFYCVVLVNSEDTEVKLILPFLKHVNRVLVLIWVSMVVTLFIPSKETIYMIAGSEAGEYVVKTPEAQEIVGDIKEIIRLQLEEMKTAN